MKSYTVTINGELYDVTVEKKAGKAENTKPAEGNGVKIEVKASMPGTIVKVEAKVGQVLKKGDSIVVLEAMKMEIPIVAPESGKVISINASAGASVASGDIIAVLG